MSSERYRKDRARDARGHSYGLARDSVLTGIGNGATLLGMMGQIILITHVLGLQAYGSFALIVAIVGLCSRFFDLNAEYTVLAFGAPNINRRPDKLAGVVQFNLLIDAASGLLGYCAVLVAAALVGGFFVGDAGAALIALYGLTMLLSTVDGSCISILQLFGRFEQIAMLQTFGEVTRIGFIAIGLWVTSNLFGVILALVAQDAILMLIGIVLATRVFRREAGLGIHEWHVHAVSGERREMISMLFQTNLVAYARLLETQVPTLLVGWMHGATEAGVLRVGLAPSLGMGKISASASSAALPRVAKLLASNRITEISRLLKHASMVAFVLLAGGGLVVVLLREPILAILAGQEGELAGGVLVLGVCIQVINGTLFWNTGLLWAAHMPRVVARAFLTASIASTPVLLALTYFWGATGAAAALLFQTLLLNIGLTFRAIEVIRGGGIRKDLARERTAANNSL